MLKNESYKKYQIFISSTFDDLKDERKGIFEAILEEGHIPAGMELFATSEKSQWEYITQRISDCDYFVLIIGNKYGSIDSDGVSWTEKEYQYALENNIPIMTFIIDDKAMISNDKYEQNPTKLQSLNGFKSAVKSNGRMCQFYNNKDDLKSKFKTSLHQYSADYPRIGWVRSDSHIIQERMIERDVEFVETFLIYQISIIKRCIYNSFNASGNINNESFELNFNQMHHIFEPMLIMSHLGQKVFESYISEIENLKNSIQFILNSPRLNLNYQLSNLFFEYIKNIGYYIPLLSEFRLYSIPQQSDIINCNIEMIKASKPEYKTHANALNVFVSYFNCTIFVNNWIIEYEQSLTTIKTDS